MNKTYAENETHRVELIRSNEVHDVFEVINKELAIVSYVKFPRTMDINASDLLEDTV